MMQKKHVLELPGTMRLLGHQDSIIQIDRERP